MRRVDIYFENTVLPMIKAQYPAVYYEMSVMILGSVGLRIDDELSDFEAAVYLNDESWSKYGRELQLSLNQLLSKTNQWKAEGSIICVHPISWLLDGNAGKVLNNKNDIPWENIAFETLFTIQNNLIAFDPKGVLSFLRDNTSEQCYPLNLWRKMLLVQLKQLILEDYFELLKSVKRHNFAESSIIFGNVLNGIYHIAFTMTQSYYPWRIHLDWAFNNLSISKSELAKYIESLLSEYDWNKRVEILHDIIEFLKDYISQNALLPDVDLFSKDLENELIWSERLSAWSNPKWKDFVLKKREEAIKNGYSPNEFWVWSLWP
ncbi:DUF4037 domain-containing protein [Tissierella sp.]|uniref:DUF4037 domain-containing protein n=1 Tax=Tissierella sp. TaxID=41274 RepID=UPI0028635907|nr:DUF4037 domain-containing protein [Tissierella sp.]MDR7856584.1 DUF4037 domain-containing protein [Tissierella sp.]